jgi:hypothetical protein
MRYSTKLILSYREASTLNPQVASKISGGDTSISHVELQNSNKSVLRCILTVIIWLVSYKISV